ncbi:hypothetical protein JCM7447_16410 [Corynebacterium amycolatum]
MLSVDAVDTCARSTSTDVVTISPSKTPAKEKNWPALNNYHGCHYELVVGAISTRNEHALNRPTIARYLEVIPDNGNSRWAGYGLIAL